MNKNIFLLPLIFVKDLFVCGKEMATNYFTVPAPAYFNTGKNDIKVSAKLNKPYTASWKETGIVGPSFGDRKTPQFGVGMWQGNSSPHFIAEYPVDLPESGSEHSQTDRLLERKTVPTVF